MKMPQMIKRPGKKPERLYNYPERGEEETWDFERIDISQMPPDIQKEFEKANKTTRLLNWDSPIPPWEEEKLEVRSGQIISYITATTLSDTINRRNGRLIYMLDTVGNKLAGGCYMLREAGDESPPYLGWTQTFDEYQHQGLGERRLALMNAYCKKVYDAHLHSSPNAYDNSKSLWDKLRRSRRAERTRLLDKDGGQRFRFIK